MWKILSFSIFPYNWIFQFLPIYFSLVLRLSASHCYCHPDKLHSLIPPFYPLELCFALSISLSLPLFLPLRHCRHLHRRYFVIYPGSCITAFSHNAKMVMTSAIINERNESWKNAPKITTTQWNCYANKTRDSWVGLCTGVTWTDIESEWFLHNISLNWKLMEI